MVKEPKLDGADILILAYLKTGKKTIREITDHLAANGINYSDESQARRKVKRLIEKGFLKKTQIKTGVMPQMRKRATNDKPTIGKFEPKHSFPGTKPRTFSELSVPNITRLRRH